MLNLADIEPGQVRPLRRCEYDQLVDTGAFADERIELIDGWLVTMSPQDAQHAYTVQRLARELTVNLDRRAAVRTQMPLALSDVSEPEPDVAVVHDADYSVHHPSTAFLIVEVSTSSLRRDRTVKAPIYARAGIPDYWIIDLQSRLVDVHRGPSDAGYSNVTSHREDEALTLLNFPDVQVQIHSILPTRRA